MIRGRAASVTSFSLPIVIFFIENLDRLLCSKLKSNYKGVEAHCRVINASPNSDQKKERNNSDRTTPSSLAHSLWPLGCVRGLLEEECPAI